MLIAFVTQSNAQVNLVPNGSFEEYVELPTAISEIDLAYPWFTASGGSPDYFHTNAPYENVSIPQNGFGNQEALQGNAYAGIHIFNKPINYGVEYIETWLLDTLIEQKCYSIDFYVSLADSASGYTVNNIGAYFSAQSINVSETRRLTEFTPQVINSASNPLIDKLGWTKISGIFYAVGGERFLTIGNFNLPENDDTVLVSGTGNGWGSLNRYGYLYIDSVFVKRCDDTGVEENSEKSPSVYPNPASESVNITLPPNTNKAELFIYTVQGQLLNQTQILGTQTINTSNLANGLYLFVIQSDGIIVGREKVIIAH